MLCWLKVCAIIGHALIVDGDTLKIEGRSIRLQGIDAPELREPYGRESKTELTAIIDAHEVSCWPDGTRSYKRIVATCFLIGTAVDIGAEMVRRGRALDCPRYSKGRYRALEPSDVRTKLQQKPYC